MLSIASYWSGSDKEDRRVLYATEYQARAHELEGNAADLIPRIQAVADIFEQQTGIALTRYSSGWRPATVNDPTKLTGAGFHSTHLDANAGDVQDTLKGEFAWWCFKNQSILKAHGLYMEHPCGTVLLAKATPWTHLTRVAPGSGLICFHPSKLSVTTWDQYLAGGGKPEGGPLGLRKP